MPEIVPDEQALREIMGNAYPAYGEVRTLIKDYPFEWKYYGKKHGWQLKVMKKGKALLYLIPMNDSLRIGFAVREDERRALLESKLSAKAKQELASAKKYTEGYPLRFTVQTKSDIESVRVTIETLNSVRS